MEDELFTNRGRCRCEASAHEDVVIHFEGTVMKQMRRDRLARRVKDAANKIGNVFKKLVRQQVL